MTEQEAIDALVTDFNDEGEQNLPPEIQPPQQEPTPNLPDISAILAEQEILKANMAKMQEELKAKNTEPQALPKTPEEIAAVEAAQKELGIANMQEQIAKQQAYIDEQNSRVEFEKTWSEFTKTHPNIERDELAKWAKDNNFEPLLANSQGWDTIYRAMKIQAQPKATPDAITPSTDDGSAESAFDRKKKGESVSDLELGIDLLKLVQ